VKKLADEFWGAGAAPVGEHPLGKGKVIWGNASRAERSD
jgi:hypothetical protein